MYNPESAIVQLKNKVLAAAADMSYFPADQTLAELFHRGFYDGAVREDLYVLNPLTHHERFQVI